LTVVPFRRRPVAVDWSGLEGAFTFASDEASHYFDMTTGEVHLVQSRLMVGEGDDGPWEADVEGRCAAGEWVHVEPLPSSVEFQWMADFIESVDAGELADQLRRALGGKRPFARFKSVLARHPDVDTRFHAYRDDRVWEAMRAWIEDHGIQPRTSELAKVTYDRGMCSLLPPGPGELTRSKWEAPFIPDGILWSLEREGILDLSGTWGDPDIGDPIEVDVIRVRGRGVSADLTFYNRGITLFRTDSEETRRIHRFCCTLANTPPSG
jgi:hypothetical protein